MSQLRKIIVTIDCQPKEGKADKFFNALWKAIEKYSTKHQVQSLQTSYIYKEDK
ncbi:hypothetical protein QEH68_06660 [Paenarthrobacter sp. OM7]|uniref:hypothetical protein n=1 Tax=Paenarthrobacter sp. OM7 TaxID=3041264 RepID=UPI0024687527|nr:hypothetical protein [Paenarthrobacter sp. OM7]WGM21849.1 hypothetical protein QEH68_06660 [Paenarthrobacter sp. OM7]